MADPLHYFRIEARELLDELSQGALALEKAPADRALVGKLLRHAHTLKGAARVVRQVGIADHAHAAEDVLAPHRDGEPVSAEAVAALLRLVDEMSAGLVAIDAPKVRAEPALPDALQAVRVDLREVDGLLDAVFEAGVSFAAMQRPFDALEEARHLAQLVSEHAGRGAEPRLQALSTELVSTLSRAHSGLARARDQADIGLVQIRERAHEIRLVPASSLFGPLERAARDAAQALGKSVAFETRGGDVRLETHVLQKIGEALLHVVRNAVAHGIEASRGAKGAGRLVVSVERREGRIRFSVSDDGAGVDVEAIRRAAVRRGLVPEGTLTRERAIELLLGGGLTTTARVDAVSGRGVGLDVVRAVAAGLKGEVAMRSEPGRGTVVEIAVPLLLSSTAALAVEAAGRTLWIPLDAVPRTLWLPDAEVSRGAGSPAVLVDGEVLPFLALQGMFRGDGRARGRRPWSVLVVAVDGVRVAVGVDRIAGVRTIVVRPLPPGATGGPAVAGATLDAAGTPELVLDPHGLVRAAAATPEPDAVEPARLPILVVDDSLTTRMLEQSILEGAGYEVDLAVSAEDGLARARARRYGAFLVDVEMPGMDGFGFVETTRADPILRETPAILVTSRNAPEDRRRGEAVGAVAYVVKSQFDQVALLALMRRLVGAR